MKKSQLLFVSAVVYVAPHLDPASGWIGFAVCVAGYLWFVVKGE